MTLSQEETTLYVPFWWRKITARYLKSILESRSLNRLPPSGRTGLEKHLSALVKPDVETELNDSSKHGLRSKALMGLDRKLGRILGLAFPRPTPFRMTTLRLYMERSGFSVWLEDPDMSVSNLMEFRFSLFADNPFPMHGYCRVLRVGKQKEGDLTRLDCRFEQCVDGWHTPKHI